MSSSSSDGKLDGSGLVGSEEESIVGSGCVGPRAEEDQIYSVPVEPLPFPPIRGRKLPGDELIRKFTRDEWRISIENYREGTKKKPQVERVPSVLRGIESNKKCFVPFIVSIGPYHHKKKKLQAFETLKLKYAQQFFHDCGDQLSIEELIAEVEKVVDNARECYEGGSIEEYDNESFTRMMFLDGCFVLHFMCMLTRTPGIGTKTTPAVRQLDMKISDAYFVRRDLFLLDNQIPSLILQVLMKFRFESEETDLIQRFLNTFYKMPPQETSWLNGIKKIFKKDSYTNGDTIIKEDQVILKLDGRPHLLDLIREHLIGPEPDSHQHHVKVSSSRHLYSVRSVTELKLAGINFRASRTHHVTDVDFKSHLICGGTLMLPPLAVDDSTKTLLLNLVAYEMSPNGPQDMRISSYICLMDSLIDHANDVKELRKQGILLNCLGSDEQLAQLFNEIADGVVTRSSAYANIKYMIEKQCKNKIQVWIAEWTHNHFSSPWTVLAFLGALLVLALTMVQTYFAVNPRGSLNS